MTFDDFGLSDPILKAVRESGYDTPTPIQTQAIPIALMGRDILGCAQTGTGKTAAFTLPMIEALSTGRSRARMPRALILEPTRELAAQVAENFDKYGKHLRLSHALLIGGEFMSEQLKTLERGVDVLIATPGRLMDMQERGKIMMTDVKIFVIDEADRMLDMGFIPDVERIASMLPSIRQTMLFSATMPPEIKRLADQFMMNPKQISVAPPASPAETVEQKKVFCTPRQKAATLRKIMAGEDISNAIVFCNRKRDVDILVKTLTKHGVNAAGLHGDMVQFKRMETLDKFKKGEIIILVASDVAARGLDIVTVSHVFNYDVPHHADDYVHRIGRTGRAGRSGKSYTFCTEDDAKSLAAIERLIKVEIPVLEVDGGSAPAEASTAANDDEDRPRRRRARSSGRTQRGAAAPPAEKASTDTAETASVEAAPLAQPEPEASPAPSSPKQAADESPSPTATDEGYEAISSAHRPQPAERAPKQGRSRASNSRQDRAEPRKRRDPRTEEASDIPGPQSFGDDNTPAFLLRPTRKTAEAS